MNKKRYLYRDAQIFVYEYPLRSRLQSMFYDTVTKTIYASFLHWFSEIFHQPIYRLPGERLW
jgi:hypothetical protein